MVSFDSPAVTAESPVLQWNLNGAVPPNGSETSFPSVAPIQETKIDSSVSVKGATGWVTKAVLTIVHNFTSVIVTV